VAACSVEAADPEHAPSASASAGKTVARAIAESDYAVLRVADIRRRFVARPVAPALPRAPAPPGFGVPEADASSFVRLSTGTLHPVFSGVVRALRPASVELPSCGGGQVVIEDAATHVRVAFALRGASDVSGEVASGFVLYASALDGNDILHRVHAEGTEDYVVFEHAPAREEVVYDVDVTRVRGLRLVSNTLEFLDEGGAPRLRIAPPWAIDASGFRIDAHIALDDCAYDTDASGPWGRSVTPPGSTRCRVRVAWHADDYPVLVDPEWSTTGSMTKKRWHHTATLLSSGKVLVAGGHDDVSYLTSAELFDGVSSFAATGSMTAIRGSHTATLLTSGKVLIVGGTDGTAPLDTTQIFDGVSSFGASSSMGTAHIEHTATLLPSGKVLIAGGRDASGQGTSAAELFDGTSAFANTGPLSVPRYGHVAALLQSGKVLVAGGNPNLPSAELFDGASFTPTGSMTMARAYSTATVLSNGKVLVAAGLTTANTFPTAETFDGTQTFTATGPMKVGSQSHTATLLASGQVLIVGGTNQGASLSRVEIFDGNQSFSDGPPLKVGRHEHQATLLPSGDVLVTGGFATGPGVLSSAEIYSPNATSGSDAGPGTGGVSGSGGAGGAGGRAASGGASGNSGATTGGRGGTDGGSGGAGAGGGGGETGGGQTTGGAQSTPDGGEPTFAMPEFGSCACELARTGSNESSVFAAAVVVLAMTSRRARHRRRN
jgi:hypothetical protein